MVPTRDAGRVLSLYDVVVESDTAYRKVERASRAEPGDETSRAAFDTQRMRTGDTSISSWFHALPNDSHPDRLRMGPNTKVHRVALGSYESNRVVTKLPDGRFLLSHPRVGPGLFGGVTHTIQPAGSNPSTDGRPYKVDEPILGGGTPKGILPYWPEYDDRQPNGRNAAADWARRHMVRAHQNALIDLEKRERDRSRQIGQAIKKGVRKVGRRLSGRIKGSQPGVRGAATTLRKVRGLGEDMTLFEAVFIEGRHTKREPAERDKEWEEHKAEVLKKYHGRTHKSGRPVKSIQAWAAGKALPRDTHETARWKATYRPVGRGQAVRSAARDEIEAPEKMKPGPREGLSQGKRGGIAGKTYREDQKPERTKPTRSGPAQGGHWNESPGSHELKAREKDPALAQDAAEKLKAAVKRMKQAKRQGPSEPEYEPDPRHQANKDKGRWTELEKRSKAWGGAGRRK